MYHRTDPFDDELLPSEGPPLLTELPEEDRIYLEDKYVRYLAYNFNNTLTLTMELLIRYNVASIQNMIILIY